MLARLLASNVPAGIQPHQVRVVAPDVGGGFGAKLIVYPEDVLIPFLALRFQRPVEEMPITSAALRRLLTPASS